MKAATVEAYRSAAKAAYTKAATVEAYRSAALAEAYMKAATVEAYRSAATVEEVGVCIVRQGPLSSRESTTELKTGSRSCSRV